MTVVVLASAVVLLVKEAPAPGGRVAVTTALGVAMGGQAATARFIGVKDVTTVVITSTITGMAADLGLLGGRGAGARGFAVRRPVAIVLMIAGALIGAAFVPWHRAAGLVLAAIVIGVVTLVGSRHARGTAERG